MTTETVNPTRLVDGIRSLLDRFRGELSGPRQATRTQLIQFLARKLGISQEAAAKLFDDLRQAGVIVRGDEPLEGGAIPDRDGQRWSIDTDGANGAGERFESEIDFTPVDEDEPQAVDLLRRAIAHRASDIHLDPYGDEIEVRFRVDGRLEHYCRLDEEIGEQMMSQLKVLARLDLVEPFQPQEGRLELPISLSEYDIRMTVTPVVSGESVALRILSRDQIIRPLEKLGLAADSLERIQELTRRGEGLLLVSGPSGAGKTTTLYSLVAHLDNCHRNVVTIEDPVEYLQPGFAQLQVDPKHDLSLASGLKTVLRMDPDVILLGEIRDPQTAAASMRAASCGKHILATFHARDAASAITGLRDLQADDRSIAGNLRAVIAQRLVRLLCRDCSQTRAINEEQAARFEAEGMTPPEAVPHAVGCDACQGVGYRDRIGVFEIAVVTPDIAEAVESGEGERDLRNRLRALGVASLQSDGLSKVRDGLTTLQEMDSLNCLLMDRSADGS